MDLERLDPVGTSEDTRLRGRTPRIALCCAERVRGIVRGTQDADIERRKDSVRA